VAGAGARLAKNDEIDIFAEALVGLVIVPREG
jgi:hypothetical protein